MAGECEDVGADAYRPFSLPGVTFSIAPASRIWYTNFIKIGTYNFPRPSHFYSGKETLYEQIHHRH